MFCGAVRILCTGAFEFTADMPGFTGLPRISLNKIRDNPLYP